MAAKLMLPALRQAAAERAKAANLRFGVAAIAPAALDPGGTPHYYGPYPNYANSPMPTGVITDITLTSGGHDYTDPVVSITDLYSTNIVPATVTATVVDGVITDVELNDGGSGYTIPIVTITDALGTGSDAEAVAAVGAPYSGGLAKFVDSLPRLGSSGVNDLAQYIPLAVADPGAYANSDYYEIALVEYSEKMHRDLDPTRLRGYVQLETPNVSGNHVALTYPDGSPIEDANGDQVFAVDDPHYLGPLIKARRNVPVRVKFTNYLPTDAGGNLFIPVDTTVMGAGMGPYGMDPPVGDMNYTQNRADVHLHGNNTVWISDGTPHQWITPAGETTSYPKGVSVVNVPDMPDPGDGSMTLFYTNQQSARLMFYHDHSYGITRLNVYAGEAAGYLLTDMVEDDLINGSNDSGVNPGGATVLPDLGIPLVIQDRTFVDANTIAYQDPTWDWGTTPGTPNTGDLWMPHVYMPNQNPWDFSGMNAFGRWHYGPWFWPPTTDITYPPIANPYYGTAPWEPPLIPGTPHPSMAMEAFMDTPIVNGTAYPHLDVDPKAYRFRILNAADDRFFNLQLYVADPAVATWDGRPNTEVKMVSAPDGREGGIPDPSTSGPTFIQIGTEGGFLPAPVVLPNQPVTWNLDQTNFDFGVVKDHTLLLGTAERADVIVDFSQFHGKTVILYNDAPAAFPALDPRYDYYTGNPDHTDVGGTPTTIAGYGPNTRTIMQFRVAETRSDGNPIEAYDLPMLSWVFAKTSTKRGVFEVSQDEIIVPEARYNSAYNRSFPGLANYVRIYETEKTFQTIAGNTVTIPFEAKAIQDEMGEAFDRDYGRMSGFLGLELPFTGAGNQNFVLLPYPSPPVEIVKGSVYGSQIGSLGDGTQIWKITHNGVDTHTIHTHLFNAQLINRVAWDNALRPPDPNELGWKETFRVNPLQDTIIALRPTLPTNIPFEVPNSVRLIDPTMPENAVLADGYVEPPVAMDPNGEPVTIINHYINFGWEYVWHCHILGHEEMDMMHSLVFGVPPEAPSNLVATGGANSAILTWSDNSNNETGFTIHRADDPDFTLGLTTFTVGENVETYTDTPIEYRSYYYRVFANNVVGDTWDYNDPNINEGAAFPSMSVDSAFSNTAAIERLPPAAPTGLRAILSPLGVAPISVDLRWTDNSLNESGFIIERMNGGGFAEVGRVGANVTRWIDTTVLPSTPYSYRVMAYNAVGNSAYSNTVDVTTPSNTPPAAPSNVRIVRIGNNFLVIGWNDNSNNETGFEIRRGSTATGPWTTINVPANTTQYRDNGLGRRRTFYYQVRSVNDFGASAWAPVPPVSGTTR
jgi:FtsP/CotA-like multicopper oxidase with cupredoxin domain